MHRLVLCSVARSSRIRCNDSSCPALDGDVIFNSRLGSVLLLSDRCVARSGWKAKLDALAREYVQLATRFVNDGRDPQRGLILGLLRIATAGRKRPFCSSAVVAMLVREPGSAQLEPRPFTFRLRVNWPRSGEHTCRRSVRSVQSLLRRPLDMSPTGLRSDLRTTTRGFDTVKEPV